MVKWKKGLCCFNKCFSIFSTKSIILSSKLTSHFRFKPQRHRKGILNNLYEDMESYGEYEDIQVMWKIIQSTSPQYGSSNKERTNNKSSYLILCFRPT
ncbi:hypothetical protein HN51_022886 [Arachis hypogaea]